MPELPEVEIVRRRLHSAVVGRLIEDVIVLDPSVCRQEPAEVRRRLVGRRIAGTARRGKWLIFDLGTVLAVVHLRMTGRLLWRPAAEDQGRQPRFVIELEGGQRLHFFDVRRFGGLWAVPTAEATAFFSELGVEPLSEEFTVACLRDLVAGRRTPLKAFLLDQRRIAGIGNIYADEALFRARLHPLRPAGSLGPREAARLWGALRETLQLGIDHEGSSVESFVDPAGARGGFQEILNVYQRTGQPCRVCGASIRRVVVGGRGTHYCPRCQPWRSARGERRKALHCTQRGH